MGNLNPIAIFTQEIGFREFALMEKSSMSARLYIHIYNTIYTICSAALRASWSVFYTIVVLGLANLIYFLQKKIPKSEKALENLIRKKLFSHEKI